MQDAVLGQALDRGHPLPGRLRGRQRAGGDRAPADEHRAGAAGSLAAAELGAGHPEIVAEHLQQAPVPGGQDLALGAVDDDRELHLFARFSCSRQRPLPAVWYGPALSR